MVSWSDSDGSRWGVCGGGGGGSSSSRPLRPNDESNPGC